MIKSEYLNKNKLSNDLFIDAESAKIVTDEICLSTGTKIIGYIQEIGLNPFGLLLFSDIQVIFYFELIC